MHWKMLGNAGKCWEMFGILGNALNSNTEHNVGESSKSGGGQAHRLRCEFITEILFQLRALGSASSERINHVSSWTQLVLLLDRFYAEIESGGPSMYVRRST